MKVTQFQRRPLNVDNHLKPCCRPHLLWALSLSRPHPVFTSENDKKLSIEKNKQGLFLSHFWKSKDHFDKTASCAALKIRISSRVLGWGGIHCFEGRRFSNVDCFLVLKYLDLEKSDGMGRHSLFWWQHQTRQLLVVPSRAPPWRWSDPVWDGEDDIDD